MNIMFEIRGTGIARSADQKPTEVELTDAMTEYVLNGHGKLISWERFLSSANPLVYDKTLVDFSSRGIPFSTQAVFDRYCYLYWHEYGTHAPMNLEEPYKPSVADLDDFAEFQAERNPMFENFEPDQYDF